MSRAAFTGRSIIAVGLALAISFFLQLTSPISSVTTVLIVANPTVGALVSKSIWRLLGTIFGGVIGITLMSFFAQSPVLYILSLGICVGAACMVATFLRLFRAYAAVLTGYTIILISAPSFAHPDTIFINAMSRLSSLAVGIVVTAAVFMATSQRKPHKTFQQIAGVVHDAVSQARRFHEAHGGDVQESDKRPHHHYGAFRALPQPLYTARDRLLAQLTALSTAMEYAAVESSEIGGRLNNLRMGLATLSGFVASFHPLWRNLSRSDVSLGPLHDDMAAVLDKVETMMADPEWLNDTRPVRDVLIAGLHDLDAREATYADASAKASFENVRDSLRQLLSVIANLGTDHHTRPKPIRLRAFMEWAPALRNGARGCAITWFAGMIWYVTAWANASLFLVYVISASSLISTTPSASRASRPMAYGTLLSIPASIAYHLWVLPNINGYPLLWATIVLFILPGLWVQFSPRWSLYAFGYIVFFVVQLDVSNPMHYDDIAVTNSWMAMALGCTLLAVVFRVVLPANDRLDAARIVSSLARSVRRLALSRSTTRTEWIVWEALQIQKVQRLLSRLTTAPGTLNRNQYGDAGMATVSLGRLLFRLKQIAANPRTPADVALTCRSALSAFADIRHDPLGTADRVEAIARGIEVRHDDAESQQQITQAIGTLEQSIHLIRLLPGFFHRHGPLQYSPEHPAATLPLTMQPA